MGDRGVVMQFLRPFYRYFAFSGRSGRAEFWQYMALLIGLGTLVEILDFNALMQSMVAGVPHIPGLTIFFSLATTIPTLAVIFRRLHDRGLSGWAFSGIYVALIPFLIVIILATAGAEGYSGRTALSPLLISMCLSLLVYEIYLIFELALPGDEFENFYGLPDSGSFDPFKKISPSRSATLNADEEVHRDHHTQTGHAKSNPMDDVVLKIERLAQLHSQGHLTSEEFAAQKGRVLAGVN